MGGLRDGSTFRAGRAMGRALAVLAWTFFAPVASAASYLAESGAEYTISAVRRGGVSLDVMPADLAVSADLYGGFVTFHRGNAEAHASVLFRRDGADVGLGSGAETQEIDLPRVGRVTATVDVGQAILANLGVGASFQQLAHVDGWAAHPDPSDAISSALVKNDLTFANASADATYSVTIRGTARTRVEVVVAGEDEFAYANAKRETYSPNVLALEARMEGMSDEERAEFIDSLPLRQRMEYINASGQLTATALHPTATFEKEFEWTFEIAPGTERSALLVLSAVGSASVVPELPSQTALLAGLPLLALRNRRRASVADRRF